MSLPKVFPLAVPLFKAIEIRDDVGFFQAVRAVLAKGDGEKRKPDDEMNHAIRQIISRAVASDEVVDIIAEVVGPARGNVVEQFVDEIAMRVE